MKMTLSLITHLKIDFFFFKKKNVLYKSLLIYTKQYEWILNISIIIFELLKRIL